MNRDIAPRIYGLCDKVTRKLEFTESIDFYLTSSAEPNAFSIHGFGYVSHIICFTSALIQQVTDDELEWIIGHEIGHLIFEHNKLDFAQRFINRGEDVRPPANLTFQYLRFCKYAEISADRIGFIAKPDIQTVTKSLFKLTYGISDKDLNFDVEAYMKQLDRIRELNVGNLFSSHPNSMIRIQALIDFASSQMYNTLNHKGLTREVLEERVGSNLLLLEIHPKNDREMCIVQLLSAAGMYMACYDQDSMSSKYEILYDWLSDYTSLPENYLYFESIEDVQKELNSVCEIVRSQYSEDACALIEHIVGISLSDGRLESDEKKRLFEISQLLNVSQDAMNLIIRRVSESYLAPNSKKNVQRLR